MQEELLIYYSVFRIVWIIYGILCRQRDKKNFFLLLLVCIETTWSSDGDSLHR